MKRRRNNPKQERKRKICRLKRRRWAKIDRYDSRRNQERALGNPSFNSGHDLDLRQGCKCRWAPDSTSKSPAMPAWSTFRTQKNKLPGRGLGHRLGGGGSIPLRERAGWYVDKWPSSALDRKVSSKGPHSRCWFRLFVNKSIINCVESRTRCAFEP